MDATAIDLPMTQRSIRHAVKRIASEKADDDVELSVVGIDRIRILVVRICRVTREALCSFSWAMRSLFD